MRAPPAEPSFPRAARSVSGLVKLPEPTSDTIELVRAAVSATKRLWQGGYRYSKAGVMLDGLVPPDRAPRALIDSVDPRRDAQMAALDDLNGRFGRGSLVLARTGLRKTWAVRAEMRSPAYTTRLAEVPIVAA